MNIRPILPILSIVAFLAASVSAESPPEGMKPFPIPMDPGLASEIALASQPVPPDGERVAVKDGHFVLGDRRFRVWGVNLCFGACFPAPADADRIAARLAAFGVNSVRFHHMDSAPWPRGILDPADPLKLHPEALKRLDLFIHLLAKRGIRANLNLHVGREASKALGLPASHPGMDKITGLFMPQLIEAQKRYARDLLDRKNPHRGVRYADDPAVAFVEITNEDSFFMWSSDRDLKELPEPYAGVLAGKWTSWLKARYGDDATLRAAWGKGAEALGEDLLADPGFKSYPAGEAEKGWVLEQHAGCSARVVPLEGASGVRIEIGKSDETNWHLQLKHRPLRIEAGKRYTLTFRARADAERDIACMVGQDRSPWGNLGFSSRARLAAEWRSFRFGFDASATEDAARLSFLLSGSGTSVELADVALCPGGREGLKAGESLGNATLFAEDETAERTLDRTRFLAESEKAYFDGMYAFLKKDLGVKALVTGTIAFGPCGLYGQSGMDYVDAHAYWHHPSFPGRPWDPANWTVEQEAMAARPAEATLPHLAACRLAGMPFTVSEYNHPAPSDFQAECVPMIAAYGAAQDWDGIWIFSYSHRTGDADRRHFDSFFDIDANPSKWGFMPAGAMIFRDGGLSPLGPAARFPLAPAGDVLGALAALHLKSGMDMLRALGGKADAKLLLESRLEVALSGEGKAVQDDSRTRLEWVRDGKEGGYFSASGPGARVLVTLGPRKGVGIEVESPVFAAVAVVSLDGRPLEESRAILVTSCGRCENAGMRFSADRRTVGRNWGGPPVAIEPVKGRVSLPSGAWTCCSLGPDGVPKSKAAMERDGEGRQVLVLDPGQGTMWHVARRGE